MKRLASCIIRHASCIMLYASPTHHARLLAGVHDDFDAAAGGLGAFGLVGAEGAEDQVFGVESVGGHVIEDRLGAMIGQVVVVGPLVGCAADGVGVGVAVDEDAVAAVVLANGGDDLVERGLGAGAQVG